ncbi:MAG: sortase domain-bontaining protein [Anaerolineales bacterium]
MNWRRTPLVVLIPLLLGALLPFGLARAALNIHKTQTNQNPAGGLIQEFESKPKHALEGYPSSLAQIGSADLVVTKSDPNSIVHEGQLVTFTITVENTGDLDATDVLITDTLGANYRFLSFDMGGLPHTHNADGPTHVWRLSNPIFSGEEVFFSLSAEVISNLTAPLDLANTVRASTTTSETNTANNAAVDTNFAPAFNLAYSVTPEGAGLNERLTFQIQVTNNGTAAAQNVRVETQSFPPELNISNMTTTKSGGTVVTSGGMVSATLGEILNGETVYISFEGTVISQPAQTRTENSLATARWAPEDPLQSKISNTISYQLRTSALPPTGFYERQTAPPYLRLGAILVSAALGLLGIAAFIYGLLARGRNPGWAGWFTGIGLLLVSAGLVFGFGALALAVSGVEFRLPEFNMPESLNGDLVHFQEPWLPKPTPQAPEALPDYPLPTLSIHEIEILPGEPPPDTSPPVRLRIEALSLDAPVRYVPFGGYTWLVAGLKDEIAWLGETSWPGLGGNTGLAGHVTLRDGADGPFHDLEKLGKGENITLFTQEKIYHYQVREISTVHFEDLTSLETTPESQLTLVTCSGWDRVRRVYDQRLVLYADLVSAEPNRRQISSVESE